jgi:hypothetical protein
MADSNRSCYTFQTLTFESGFLDAGVDATYIITMEDGPRYKECFEKLKVYQPTKTVYLVVNKGFKKCKKTLPKQTSMYDIIDANMQIFNHSKEHKYENVLILEDDFIFNDTILDPTVSTRVNTFLNERRRTSFMYVLGCLPAYVVPYTLHTFRVIWAHAMHAVIYSSSLREEILEYSEKNVIHDWDMDLSYLCLKRMNKFTYKFPLCYQTIPNTENKQAWGMSKPTEYVLNTYIKATEFDTKPEPGTSILYVMANILFILTILLVVIIAYSIYIWHLPLKKSATTRRFYSKSK